MFESLLPSLAIKLLCHLFTSNGIKNSCSACDWGMLININWFFKVKSSHENLLVLILHHRTSAVTGTAILFWINSVWNIQIKPIEPYLNHVLYSIYVYPLFRHHTEKCLQIKVLNTILQLIVFLRELTDFNKKDSANITNNIIIYNIDTVSADALI